MKTDHSKHQNEVREFFKKIYPGLQQFEVCEQLGIDKNKLYLSIAHNRLSDGMVGRIFKKNKQAALDNYEFLVDFSEKKTKDIE